jgi:predicted Rossmann-fold nucleotide-binding protein
MTAIMKLIITLGGGGGRGTLKELMVTYTIYYTIYLHNTIYLTMWFNLVYELVQLLHFQGFSVFLSTKLLFG